MIGSDTFIIVDFRCNENKTSLAFASAISALRNVRRAAVLIYVASTMVPDCRFRSSFKTETCPALSINSILAGPACASLSVADFSLAKNVSDDMDATWVLDDAIHSPIEWGFCMACCLTAFAARRSELPSRKTGFTALPLIAS